MTRKEEVPKRRKRSSSRPAWGQPVPGQYEKLRDYYSGDKSGFPENNDRVKAYQMLANMNRPPVRQPSRFDRNEARSATSDKKPITSKNRSKPSKQVDDKIKPYKEPTMKDFEAVTMADLMGGGGGGRAFGGKYYDTFSNLPSIPDVQSESLGILDELVQGMLFDQGGGQYDYESQMHNVAKGIRQAYQADIRAIRHNNKEARKDTREARNKIGDLYAGLAQAYGQDAAAAQTSGNQAAAQAQQIAQEAAGNLTNSAQQINAQEAELLKNLGVQAAAPDIIPDSTGNVAQGLARINEIGANAAATQAGMGEVNQQYFQRGAAGARMEGADRQADLLEGLTDYVRGNRDQIGQLKGQRARDIAEARANMAQQAAEAQAAADSEQWSRLMDYMGMRSDLEQANFDNAMAAADFNWGTQMDKEGILQTRREFGQDLKNDRFNQNLDLSQLNLDMYEAQQRALDNRANRQLRIREQDMQALRDSASGGANDPFEGLPSSVSDPIKVIQKMVPGNNRKQEQTLVNIIEGLRRTPEWQTGSFTNSGGNRQEYKMTPEKAAAMAEQVARARGIRDPQLIAALRMAAMAAR